MYPIWNITYPVILTQLCVVSFTGLKGLTGETGNVGAPGLDGGTCLEIPADIIFLIDESGSILASEFQLQKQFVLDTINNLPLVSPDVARISLVTFGGTVSTHFDLNVSDKITPSLCG